MSTTSSQTTAQLCSATPTVSVNDNRGLSVRTLQYNRCTVGEAANEWVTQQHFNALGQLISRLDPRFHSAQQSDPAVLPNFSYQNALSGQVLQNHSQDAGRHITLHDVAGGPVWQENSRGFLKRLAYDALHRVSAIFEQDGASAPERVSERFVYGQQAGPFDTFGRLLRHYDTAGLNEVLHYNYRGQPLQSVRQLLFDDAAQSDWPADETQRVTWLEAERYASSITYNALDEVLGTVDALGNQQHRYLDVAGQLARSGLTLAADSEERPVLTSITYSAGGQVLREVAGNGVVSTYTYEPQTLRLSRLTATRPALAGRSTLLQDLNYSYDPVGNILSIDDAAIATAYANNQQVEPVNAYQYDALYQLCAASGRENIGASRQGPILPVAGGLDANQYSNYSRQYRYDRGGNLTQMRHVGFSSYTLDMQVSNTSNRAVAQTGFLTATDVEGQFDAAGNLQQLVAGQPLAWDGRNQLQRVTQIQRSGADDDEEHYQYDGAGARVRKTMVSQTSGTTRRAQVIYLPGLELRRTQRTQGTTTATEEELHVLSLGSTGRQQVRLLHWVTGQPTDIPNNQLRGSLGNQIGSSVLELDQNADVLTQEEYYPFGGTAVWSGKSTSETKYKFVRYSGKERDATGLYYYGFRYYGPWLGRWINPDPGGTVDGLNLYRMVRNNPVNYVDNAGQMGIRYDPATDTFASDHSRPGSHLNLGVLEGVVKDIINTTPLNDAEQLLLATHDPQSKGNAKQIAQKMKSQKFLSIFNCAVCHKIPYSAVEKSLLKLVQTNPAPLTSAWSTLELLLQGLHGHGFASAAAQEVALLQSNLASPSTKPQVAVNVNRILNEFDASTDNLYVGFAQTNSSIGARIDKHYDVVSPGTAPVAATPRGANLEQSLNHLEASLGLKKTSPIQQVIKGLKWEESSNVDHIGWVVVV
ncbi:insecticidal toxin complex protein TccC [Pseudomonas fluorescens]|uniref:RHS repeat-associated core domain-containing protein n=1 Tax=Pseudomonas fluorescens TaxID=294 RepID=UPI00209E88C7|nr:RHS repeat-associated core domain-containing protein [Pseudomonas fluorescens]MCP1489889.1 insecticidal toxin complex protein TccC [Pseudomonas fluorescens]